jgi:hypothetical protein
MYEIINQPIPAGYYSPQEQVGFAVETIRSAAKLLAFSGVDELETTLAQIEKHLVHLAGAGLIAGITFFLQDDRFVCGIQASISLYECADYEKVDLSRLQFLANPEACGSLQIVCVDSALAQQILGEDWLPQSSAALECTQVNLKVSGNESDSHQEDNDEYDDEY